MKCKNFDPDGIAQKNNNLFGLFHKKEEAGVIVIPVPWEVTVSYRAGTARAPIAILEASYQVDLGDEDIPRAWESGIALDYDPVTSMILFENKILRAKAQECIKHLETGGKPNDPGIYKLWKEVNDGGKILADWLKHRSLGYLSLGKMVGVLGGDHSVPLGLMQALAERHKEYGILHIDAHFDLRKDFEGFIYSHASIMRNASQILEVKRIVHVGIRSYSNKEMDFVYHSGGRHFAYTSRNMEQNRSIAKSWDTTCLEIIARLPEKVYVSFDIDGLDPSNCPHTGTPVPGGLSFEQVFYLIKKVAEERKIIGFDLCEVTPGTDDTNEYANDWDSLVGATALWRLSILSAFSQNRK